MLYSNLYRRVVLNQLVSSDLNITVAGVVAGEDGVDGVIDVEEAAVELDS